MKLRRPIRFTIASACVLALFATSAQATVYPGFPINDDRVAFTIEDLVRNPYSFIVNNSFARALQAGTIVETPEATRLCDEFNQRGCNLDANADLSVNSVIPACAEAIENCIKSLEFVKSDGTVVKAKFLRYFKGKTFKGPEELGMPGGSRPSLWEAPGVTNGGGTEQYVVNTIVIWNYLKGLATVEAFNASVFAVKGKTDARFTEPKIYVGPAAYGVYASVTDSGEITYDGSCVATEVGFCAERTDFAPNTRIKLTLQLSNKVTGWLHGRIAKPDISVTPLNNLYNTLSVEADTVDVPMMYGQFNKKDMTAEFLDNFNKTQRLGRGKVVESFWTQFYPESRFASTLITTFAEKVENKASGVNGFWNLSSIYNNSDNKCLNDSSKLVGFVTTNAMAYSGSAPAWDGQTLEYKVAGLHLLPDGKTPASGSYDLAIRSEAARCLYGFTSAPISATVSVTSADGQPKVATTVLNEKNGWLYLAAYGFSFSAPTIKIKLSQEKAAEPTASTTPSATPSATASPTATKAVIKTIKCVKGKTVKTVKGVKPKCPAGYKSK
jgi:hypothetical protein